MDETENPQSPEITPYDLSGWGELAPPVDTATDVAKTIPAKLTTGASSILGIPGAIGSWAQEKILQGAGKVFGPEIEADVRRGLVAGLSDEEREAVESGRATRNLEMGTIPTMLGMEESTKETLPFTQYEPETTPGRYAGTAAEFVGGTLPFAALGPGGLSARMGLAAREAGTAVLSGVGSEAGADYAKAINAPEYEGYFRLIGAIGTPVAAKSVGKNITEVFQGVGRGVAPGAEYIDNKVAELLMEDLQNGSSPMTLAQVQEELARGNAPALFDMAGKNTRAYLQQVYKLSPEITKGIDELNALTKARGADASMNVIDYIDSTYGNIGKFKIEDLALDAAKTETDAAYRLSRTLPNAQNMWTPELSEFAFSNGYVQKAMQEVNDILGSKRAGGFGADMYNVDLSYWDMVKKRVDDYINKTDPANKMNASSVDTNQHAGAVAAKKRLVQLLDTAVPEYADARGAALDKLNVKNAPEAGEKFLSLRKARDFEENMDVFRNLKPEQQELFRRGFLRSVYDQIGSKKTLNGVVDKLTSPSGRKYYREVLGDDVYNDIVGVTAAAQTKANLEAIQESGVWKRLAEGSLQAADLIKTAGSVGTVVVGGTKSMGAGAIAAGIAAVLDTVKNKVILNYAERKVAPEVIKLMQSSDPKDIARLGQIISTNTDAAKVLQKYNGALVNFGLSLGLSGKEQAQSDERDALKGWGDIVPPGQEQPTPENAMRHGGRIGRKSGGRVGSNAISSEVAQTRALLSNKTATMLSMPDDAIVTALHMAKQN